ncbi:MAG: galactokinase [Cyclobacteriaceae bacterium]|nr:galactokinase [Cyclobacteriaceae bacterium]
MNDSLPSSFFQHFNTEPVLVRAPGRINLLGEHLDYNEGWVLPAAINKEFVFALAPNQSNDFNIVAQDLNESASFSLDELHKGEGWVSYLMGVIQGILHKGKKVKGVDCMFTSNLPVGAGLSSSAALCCGFGFALNEIFQSGLTKLDLAQIAQYSEHEFAGVKCGIMDQYASLFSRKDHLILLDCREVSHDIIPFKLDGFQILLVDTNVKHDLASSAYNARRAACEEGVALLRKKNDQISTLRDVSHEALIASKEAFQKDTFLQCQYVVEEMARVKVGAQYLKENNLNGFGQLMYQSHYGLKDKYHVSCSELDFLVSIASDVGVIGSRMMGGGFGGCTLNLIEESKVENFMEIVKKRYPTQFDRIPAVYVVDTEDGVGVIS